MMGEYIIYVNGIYFGGVFDDRFLVKITNTNNDYALSQVIPYKKRKTNVSCWKYWWPRIFRKPCVRHNKKFVKLTKQKNN